MLQLHLLEAVHNLRPSNIDVHMQDEHVVMSSSLSYTQIELRCTTYYLQPTGAGVVSIDGSLRVTRFRGSSFGDVDHGKLVIYLSASLGTTSNACFLSAGAC